MYMCICIYVYDIFQVTTVFYVSFLRSPKLKFSKHSHVIYHRKAFLMLISDFEFVLPDFGFLVPGERVNYYIHHILVYNPVANNDVCS